MSRESAQRPSVLLPVFVTALIASIVVVRDWVVHENVTVASVFTAHHADEFRYAIHLGTLIVLGLLVAAKPKRRAPAWVAGLILVVVNTMATARIVITMRAPPYAAVAGVVLNHVDVGHHSGRHAHLVCFESFSRDSRSATIDGSALAPPFLPIPVDWRELENLDDFMCVGDR